MAYPDGNPKTLHGEKKVPMGLVSPVAMAHEAMALKLGEQKYGTANWRKDAVSASVYYHAALRHMQLWWEGEDLDEESKAHHLGHARACMGILLDAASVDKLNDNRPPKGGLAAILKQYQEVDSVEAPKAEAPKPTLYRYVGPNRLYKQLEFTLRHGNQGPYMHADVQFERFAEIVKVVRSSGAALMWKAQHVPGYFLVIGDSQ